MRKFCLMSFVVVLACLAAVDRTAGADRSPGSIVYENVVNSVVAVFFGDPGQGRVQGSGVVIGPNTLVTNCHVVGKADSGVVVQALTDGVAVQKFEMTADVGDVREDRDLCVLLVDDLSDPPAVPAVLGITSGLSVGDDVYAVGSLAGSPVKLSKGVISQFRNCRDMGFSGDACSGQPAPIIRFDARIGLGSSGGGLFDAQGRLIGITAFVRGDQAFALPVEWVKELREYSVILRSKALDKAEEVGDIGGAIHIAREIPDAYIRVRTMARIAREQGVRGDRRGARFTMVAALVAVGEIEREWRRDSALGYVSVQQARIGDVDSAIETAKSIKVARARARTFRKAADIQCRAGKVATAARILAMSFAAIAEIANANDRGGRLAEAAVVQARCGDQAAWATLRKAEREVARGGEPASIDAVEHARRLVGDKLR